MKHILSSFKVTFFFAFVYLFSLISLAQNSGMVFKNKSISGGTSVDSRVGLIPGVQSMDKKYSFTGCDVYRHNLSVGENVENLVGGDQTSEKAEFFKDQNFNVETKVIDTEAYCDTQFAIVANSKEYKVNSIDLFQKDFDSLRAFYIENNLYLFGFNRDEIFENAIRINLTLLAESNDLNKAITYLPQSIFEKMANLNAFINGKEIIFISASDIDANKTKVFLNKVNLENFQKSELLLESNKSIQNFQFRVSDDNQYLISSFSRVDYGGGLIGSDRVRLIDLNTFSYVYREKENIFPDFKRLFNTSFQTAKRPDLILVLSTFESRTSSDGYKNYKIVATEISTLSKKSRIIFEKNLDLKKFTNVLFVKKDETKKQFQFYFLAQWNDNMSQDPKPLPNAHSSLLMSYSEVTGSFQIDN